MRDYEGAEWKAVEEVFHRAMRCEKCFQQGSAERSRVDIAQPRWIGPAYFTQQKRIMLITMIPGAGRDPETDEKNKKFNTVLHGYRDGSVSLKEYFEFQYDYIPEWGSRPRGRYYDFYVTGFGLDLNKIAIGCIAWCAEKEDRRIADMFSLCFNVHTSKLIKCLSPHVIILSGDAAAKFSVDISRLLRSVKVLRTLSYAHRKGKDIESKECDRIRMALAR